MNLERISVGGLHLGELAEGDFRMLGAAEIESDLGFALGSPPRSSATFPSASELVSTSSAIPPASPSSYQLLDSGDYRRLEVFNGLRVSRPCPSAKWLCGLPPGEWKAVDLAYVETSAADGERGGGDKGGRAASAAREGVWEGPAAALLEDQEREATAAEAEAHAGGGGAVASAARADADAGMSAAAVDGTPVAKEWSIDSGLGFRLGLQPGLSGQVGVFRLLMIASDWLMVPLVPFGCILMPPDTFRWQVGAFPEQQANWEWLHAACTLALRRRRRTIAQAHADGDEGGPPPLRVLNLFAHTGGSTLACAAAGAAFARERALCAEGTSVLAPIEVVHLDGARSAVGRARANAQLSGLEDERVRWICEDALTFVQRAVRRGDRFDGIIFDPPAFGRGGQKSKGKRGGQKGKGGGGGGEWRIQRDLPLLVDGLRALLSDEAAFVLLTCHDARWPAAELREIVNDLLDDERKSGVEQGSMILRAADAGRDLPMGEFARWCESSE